MKAKGVNRAIIASAVVGVLVSTYALYVEMAAEARPGYKALCDIAEHASCSRVLTSKYAKGLGLVTKNSQLEIPNCAYGIIFYCLIISLFRFSKGYLHLMFSLYIYINVWCIIIYQLMVVVNLIATFDVTWIVRVQLLMSLLSVATCFYLAYLLAFVLRDFCVVCVSTYIVNGFILYFLIKKHKLLVNKDK